MQYKSSTFSFGQKSTSFTKYLQLSYGGSRSWTYTDFLYTEFLWSMRKGEFSFKNIDLSHIFEY